MWCWRHCAGQQFYKININWNHIKSEHNITNISELQSSKIITWFILIRYAGEITQLPPKGIFLIHLFSKANCILCNLKSWPCSSCFLLLIVKQSWLFYNKCSSNLTELELKLYPYHVCLVLTYQCNDEQVSLPW